MAKFDDALRGYAYPVMKRDNFICRYCGLNGKASFSNWLSLSCDHLLPKGHPNRDHLDFIVTACFFCNVADNQYFRHAEKRRLQFDGLSQEELISQRKPYVDKVRQNYREFWESSVR